MQLSLSTRTREWLKELATKQGAPVSELAREYIEDRVYLFGLPPKFYARIQAEADRRRLPLNALILDHLAEVAGALKDAPPSKTSRVLGPMHQLAEAVAHDRMRPETQGDRVQVKVSMRTGGWLQRLADSQSAPLTEVTIKYLEERLYLFGLPPKLYARLQADADRQRLPLRALVLDLLAALAEKLPDAKPGLVVPMNLLPVPPAAKKSAR